MSWFLAESNSSLLQSKVDLIPIGIQRYIAPIYQGDFRQVVFIAYKILERYKKTCMGYILSEWHGIMSTNCPNPK